jgi:hypothetical protein
VKDDQNYPGWFLWLWERGLIVFVAVAVAVMVAGAGLAYYFESRLGRIEERLTSEPPRRYQAPNLDDYAAPDVSPDAIAIEQTVYVPAYSHVYYDGGRPQLLETTLSIRNTDAGHPIYVRSVKYYDTKGKLVKTYVDRLIRLDALATIEFLVDQRETEGGSGANFIVDWLATDSVTEPVVDAVMVATSGTRAFSFSSSGRPLSATLPASGQ